MLSFNGGIPSTVSGYVVGSQNSIAADLTMASFAYTAGMASVLPLTLRLQQFSAKKTLLCLIFPVLIFLNFLYTVTDQPLAMVMISFTIGFIKMIATLIVVISLIPILMPRGERYQLYCIYYPLSLVFGPVSGFLSAIIADHWGWKFGLHTQNLFLFTGLLIIVFLVHPNRQSKKVPLYGYDWLGTVLYSITLILCCYVFAYGVTEDWFNSVKVKLASAGAIISGMLFIRQSLAVRRPLMNFNFLKQWKPMLGVSILGMFCLFFSTSALISPFLNVVFRNNPVESAQINTYVIPGYLTGTTLCFLYYRKFTRFNTMAAVCCASYLLSNLLMYRLTSVYTAPGDLFLPMFLRAMATVIAYISVGIYVTSNISYVLINDITLLIITMRSLFAPAIGTAFYSNMIYGGTVRYTDKLAANMDSLSPFVAARNASLFYNVKTQATLLAIRDVYGLLILVGFVMLAFLIVFPFHGSDKRVVFDWKKPFYGKEVAQSIPV
ncbi:hypothetical protein SNE26_07205 [Mucilaginibacter sp. cycad4]|uniref:hypothetical protein n=1 Tax=Mucilaginibacter sp. cycad4 TaxID=3342096 RepID=UPI002AAC49EF|nr:hypothetical protein [Mucilaginibacter gossypii]WPV01559.1 hypothetical protein SNE26_07205 [Mucilaginibacter gossypii]